MASPQPQQSQLTLQLPPGLLGVEVQEPAADGGDVIESLNGTAVDGGEFDESPVNTTPRKPLPPSQRFAKHIQSVAASAEEVISCAPPTMAAPSSPKTAVDDESPAQTSGSGETPVDGDIARDRNNTQDSGNENNASSQKQQQNSAHTIGSMTSSYRTGWTRPPKFSPPTQSFLPSSSETAVQRKLRETRAAVQREEEEETRKLEEAKAEAERLEQERLAENERLDHEILAKRLAVEKLEQERLQHEKELEDQRKPAAAAPTFADNGLEEEETDHCCRRLSRPVSLGIVFVNFTVWAYIISEQQSTGIYLGYKYPGCKGLVPLFIGNGRCNGNAYNSEECGWDGGDCLEINEKYP